MTERRRSFWGWGYEDRLADDGARRGLVAMASAMLRSDALSLRPLPALADLYLPAPRVPIPAALEAFCVASRWERALHTHGRGYLDVVRGFHGDFADAPDFVALPGSEEEIDAVLAWAAAGDVAVIPFGGGTSVVGGVSMDRGASDRAVVSLDLRNLSRVVEIDDVSRAARIQAGAAGPALEAQLAASDFTLRHFPQSFELSTLGGWLATRAGGHFATGYTHIDDLVESIRMLTPAGVWASRRVPASGAGPSPDRLVLGSEGSLGVITEAWVRVRCRPRARISATVRFPDFDAGVRAVRDIAQAYLLPANCRLLDPREAALHRVVGDGSAVLLLGFEAAERARVIAAAMDQALDIARGHGGHSDGPREALGAEPEARGAADTWRRAFLDAPYLMNALVSIGAIVDTFETACTWAGFEALHAGVVAATRDAMKRVCGGGFLSCRFTHVYPDGPAPYYTFIAPARDDGAIAQWRVIKEAASDALLAHGGTITHHHAVGRLHRPWYERQRPAPMGEVLAAVKATLDPAGILNPGVLIAGRASDQ